MKAIQSGPKKLTHKNITLCRLCEIGSEEAKELYEKLLKEREAAGDKPSGLFGNLTSTTGRSQVKLSAKPTTDQADAYYQETEEDLPEDAYTDEVTVHVPKVTPEMEKEYLSKKNS